MSSNDRTAPLPSEQYSAAAAHTTNAVSGSLAASAPAMMEDNFVISSAEIRGIIIDTCRQVIGDKHYEHSRAGDWNSVIITTILNSLMAELDRAPDRRFKLIVNSSIAQCVPPEGTLTAPGGTRGLHVANAAFWDPPFDGMFSHKFAAEGNRDFDVIVSIVWLSHDGYRRRERAEPEHKPPEVVA